MCILQTLRWPEQVLGNFARAGKMQVICNVTVRQFCSWRHKVMNISTVCMFILLHDRKGYLFCGGSYIFTSFWLEVSPQLTSPHSPGWQFWGAVPLQIVACWVLLYVQQLYPHIWRGHSTLLFQRESYIICQWKLPKSGMAVLYHLRW